jgi:hypothetical protein
MEFSDLELEIVVHAIRLNTLCKLTYHDSIKFDHLLQDVFRDIKFISVGNEVLKDAVKNAYLDLSLEFNERQVFIVLLSRLPKYFIMIIVPDIFY